MSPRAFLLSIVCGVIVCGCNTAPHSTRAATDSGISHAASTSIDTVAVSPPSAAPEPLVDAAPTQAPDSTPAAIVRRYYAAIAAHDYDAAYALWGQNGQTSHQSRTQFAAGFAQTANVHVTITDSVRIEGAAGSQYATIPVAVDATLRDGSMQHFTGTYTLRRAMVTGASEADRRWHIYSAELHAVH